MVLDGGAIGLLMLNALGAMTKIALVAIVGYMCAIYPRNDPLLSTIALKNLSRLSNLICLPALIITSIGAGLSLNLLSRMAVLILFSVLTTFISYALAGTIGKAIDGNVSNLYIPICVAIASPNIVSMPLMIMQTICDQTIINSDYDGDSSLCFTESSSMIFIYSIGWHLCYWGYGYPLLRTAISSNCGQGLAVVDVTQPTGTPSPTTAPIRTIHSSPSVRLLRSMAQLRDYKSISDAFSDFQQHMHVTNRLQSFCGWCHEVLLSPLMVSIYIGVFIGLIKPLQELLFLSNASLRPLGASLETLGQPVVCLNSLIMSASLAKVNLGWAHDTSLSYFRERFMEGSEVWLTRIEHFLFQLGPNDSLASGSRRASSLHLFNSSSSSKKIIPLSEDSKQNGGDVYTISPLHDDSYSLDYIKEVQYVKGESALHKSEPVATMELPNLNGHDLQDRAKVNDLVNKPHWRSVVALFTCRMVLPVFFILALLQAFKASGIVQPTDRMLQLVVLIESASPPAQLIIVSLNQLDSPRVASGMAYLYIFMYISSIFTMTVWTTIALVTFY